MSGPSRHFHQPYPFQNQILRFSRLLETGFLLTGGTAVERAYPNQPGSARAFTPFDTEAAS